MYTISEKFTPKPCAKNKHNILPAALCEDPLAITEGTYSPADGPYPDGIKVTYTCDEGYLLTTGDAEHTCIEGTWDGTIPCCCKLLLNI